MSILEDVESELLGAGGSFELTRESVLGEEMDVFSSRKRSLIEILADSRGFGDMEYLIYGDRRITFGEHFSAVCSIARVLSERYGVGKGDRVAILAANCPEWIATYWATIALGGIAVGLNGWWVRDEILYGVADCSPKLLVGDRKRLERVDGDELGVPVLEIETDLREAWGAHPDAELPEVEIDEDDPATILYTSGTTGRPKGAVTSHRNIVSTCQLQVYHGFRMLMAGMRSGTHDGEMAPPCQLTSNPLFHVSGLYTAAVTFLANGVKTIYTVGRFDPLQVLELIQRERVTGWSPMGTMAYRVSNHPDVEQYDLSTVKQIGSGGAPMSSELWDRIRAVFPNAKASLALGYGLTESTALATLSWGEDIHEHPGSAGRPMPTVELEIRDPEGNPVPDGTEGEIYLRGPLVMLGYWNRTDETDETILPGRWLRTGDWGRLIDGRLYIASRKRDLILRGGENVYPIEIEQRLEAHPAVREAAALGVDHPELGQEVKAIVVLEDGASADPEELREWVAGGLAYYKVPAHWEIREEPLPRNATGKILKNVLLGQTESAFEED